MKRATISIAILILLIMTVFIGVSADGTSPDVVSLKIESYPAKTVYGAFDQFEPAGLSVSCQFGDGSSRALSNSELAFSYQQDGRFRVGDEYVIISYGGKSLHLPVTVNPINYQLDATLGNVSITYNGRYQSYTQALPGIVGLDGIPLTVTAYGGGTNVGEYEVAIDFETESRDYLTPESRVVKMTILPMEVDVVWSNLSFIYDGRSKTPSASYVNAEGATVDLSVIGGATNAGRYTARISIGDPNYTFRESTTEFEIKKADYDMSAVSWSATSFTYDGSKKSVIVQGLPRGVRVVGYEGDVASEAGKYTARATLSWDKTNYNDPVMPAHTWEILPANYDLSGFRFIASTFVYDGVMHYPNLEGSMPVGADGIKLEYEFSAGACHVSDGKVSVIISFQTKSNNYITPPDQYSSVTITPRGINVLWGNTQLSYTGERQVPSATAKECSVKVTGGALSVGKYTATVESQNSDYYVVNDKCEFNIVKANNSWKTSPAATTCYEGREIKIVGESRFGEPSYTFYSDPQGKNRIEKPTAPGKYYVVISVAETMNYAGLKSNVIPFEIVEIKPVSFIAKIQRDSLLAFDTLSASDLVCSVINNDGSSQQVDSSLVEIIYQNGSSLRKNDESITVKYGQFVLNVPVEVGFADYDLSGIKWENFSVTYTGEPQSPLLVGLPDGVSVIEYIGGDVTDAGVYTVTARLEYDRANYNPPKMPTCQFRIGKKAVTTPYITATYNGSYQRPAPSSLYTVVLGDDYLDTGVYAVTLKLTDSENYIFSETMSDTANGIFEIIPATISVKISDTRLRLFENLGSANYQITEGGAFGSDYVGLEFYLEGKQILARSKNPNYILIVEPGRLIRLPYPTLRHGIILFGLLLLLILILSCLVTVYKKRHNLAKVGGIIKCRIRHRNFSVADPIEEPRVIASSNDEDNSEQKWFIEDKSTLAVDEPHADMLITDPLAKSLLKKEGDVIYTEGTGRAQISVGQLSDAFEMDDVVDINALKEKSLISEDVGYVKLVGGGKIDKPLTVYANDFTLSAIKMIALSGGQAIKSVTLKGKPKEEKE